MNEVRGGLRHCMTDGDIPCLVPSLSRDVLELGAIIEYTPL